MNWDWKGGVWGQFGAAIDMMENTIRACPESRWGDRSRPPEFWYLVYHTLFFLDLYLYEGGEATFRPPSPFTLSELEPAGVMPDRVYSQAEMLAYLEHGRRRCRAVIEAMTDEQAAAPCAFPERKLSNFDLLLYNMRHVQHHGAQLHLMLRHSIDDAPLWVSKTKVALRDEQRVG